MLAGKARTDGQLHDLYVQAEVARTRSRLLAGQLHATQRRTQENWQRIRAAWDQTERIRAQRLAARTDPDRLRFSAYARLQARLASMPVIEQAKGIIIAEQGCPAEQAFQLLVGASQRSGMKLNDLAAELVARARDRATAGGHDHDRERHQHEQTCAATPCHGARTRRSCRDSRGPFADAPGDAGRRQLRG